MTDQSLRASGIRKLFAGVPALDGVDLTVTPGRVVGLVGHNGAGKSTLLKVLSGAYQPDGGQLLIGDRPVSFSGPAAALEHGISTVYQELSLLPNLTVTENTFLGREVRSRGVLAKGVMRKQTQELLERFGIEARAGHRVGDYPVATRQLLEIAIATTRQARYLLLDEPTTSLEGEQVESLLTLVRHLAVEEGLGIVFINHKLDELLTVSDEVVALVDGKVRIHSSTDQVDRREIIRAIAGNDLDEHEGVPAAELIASQPADTGAVALEVRNLVTDDLDDVSLVAREGMVLGIYGLVGSGRTELLRTLVGLHRVKGGDIELFGKPYSPKDPEDARRHAVVYLTEERKVDGIVPELSSVTNVVLPILREYTRFGLLDRRRVRAAALDLLGTLAIRGDVDGPVVQLSGGNQQKVLLARALAQKPRVLLLDEPTKGVDIGVKAELHQLLRQLAHHSGLAVVVVSSEEEEVLEVADEVVTFKARACDGVAVPAASLTIKQLREAAWDAA